MIVYKLEFEGSSYIDSNLGHMVDMIKDMEVADKVLISKLEMTKEDYEALPEFYGW